MNKTYLWYKSLMFILLIGLISRFITFNFDMSYVLLSVGLDQYHLNKFHIPELILIQYTPEKWWGKLAGNIFFAVILLGLFKKQNWARIAIVISAIISFCLYIISLKHYLIQRILVANSFTWFGIYLLGAIIVLNMVFLIVIILFFSSNNLRILFNSKRRKINGTFPEVPGSD